MVTQLKLGEIAVDVVFEGHQERPSQRLSADRPGAHFRPVAHEPRHHPRLRDFQAGLDQAAADEAARAGTRNAARISRPRKPLRLGKALSAAGDRRRCGPDGRIEAQPDDSAGAPGHR